MSAFADYLLAMQKLLDLREAAENNEDRILANALTVAHSHLRSECNRLFPVQWTCPEELDRYVP